MAQWEANSEFITISEPSVGSDAFGIKYWILEKYRAVCNHYNLYCDPVYMDENYEYPIDKDIEGEINYHKWEGYDWNLVLGDDVPTDTPTDAPTIAPTMQQLTHQPMHQLMTDEQFNVFQ